MRKCIAEFGYIYDTLSSCEQVISDDEQQSAILYGLPLEHENQQSDDLRRVVSTSLNVKARLKSLNSQVSTTANVAMQQHPP